MAERPPSNRQMGLKVLRAFHPNEKFVAIYRIERRTRAEKE